MSESKVNIVETVFLLGLVAPLDLFEMFFTFTGAPLILSIFDAITWFIIFLWLLFKGGRWKRSAARQGGWFVASGLEFFPGLELLPLRTFSLVATIISLNSKKEASESE